MKKILIYGDSNVWGDNFFTGIRIPDEKQWSNILQKKLGKDFKILQEGLPGRIAGNEEKEKVYKNGRDTFLSTFRTNAPVDCLIIALGTNDLQLKYNKDSKKIVNDLLWYTECIENEFADLDNQKKYFVDGKMPKIMYLLPPNFEYNNRENGVFDGTKEKQRQEIIKMFTDRNIPNTIVVDNIPLFEDGIHLNYEGHEKIADIIYHKLQDK